MAARQWAGRAHIKGPRSLRMFLLAVSIIGVQICWGVETSYCTPYLLELGLTKSKLSLVWIAGPISGLIMQPIIGVVADRSTNRLGRRRPFMIWGSVVVAFFMYLLGWSKEVSEMFISDKDTVRSATIPLAVFSIYAIDFAINAVQTCCRSLIVDILPVSQQQLGSAWANRMIAGGTVLAFAAGALDLEAVFGSALGDSQFKKLISIAIVVLLTTVGITSYCVSERVLLSNGDEGEQKSLIRGIQTTTVELYETATHLPSRIQAICNVQFWSMICWFPFYFYSTTWVGEIHLRYETPVASQKHLDTTSAIGRAGSQVMIIFSLLGGLCSIALPMLIRSPADEEHTPLHGPASSSSSTSSNKNTHHKSTKPFLLTAWTLSQIQFSLAMAYAPLVTSVRAATVVVALCAIPQALSNWAPFAFLGVEINRLADSERDSLPLSEKNKKSDVMSHRSDRKVSSGGLLLSQSQYQQQYGSDEEDEEISGTSELSGRYLGILNVYMTIPQLIGSAISTLVFSIFEPGKASNGTVGVADQSGYNGIAVCFFIGSIASLVAARASRRLRT